KEQVLIGRVSTVLMMLVAGFFALQLSNALQGFEIMLQVGAGTGLLFILRWFWWRINAISEIVAMVVSFVVAVILKLNEFGLASWQELLIGISITTACWVSAAFLTSPADTDTLKSFCRHINPGGPGWRTTYRELAKEGTVPESETVNIPRGILCMMLGCIAVYSVLFATGFWLYDETAEAAVLTIAAVAASAGIVRLRFND
ncbi:MAG: Na+:solute symporter, partial [Gammaproteobacteria bacterium]|nr:Na+:solute symporter [Gammaproteobacteria bacterium]